MQTANFHYNSGVNHKKPHMILRLLPQFVDERSVAAIIPAFFGSVVGLSRAPKMSKGQAVYRVFVGTITSIYLSPPVMDLIGFAHKPEHWRSAIAFLVGISGYSLIPVVTDAFMAQIKKRLKDAGGK